MFTRHKKLITTLFISLVVMVGVFGILGVAVASGEPPDVAEIIAEEVSQPSTSDAQGSSASKISNFLGWTFYYIAISFSRLVSLLIELLVKHVIVYNDFLSMRIVTAGWIIVRDVCNNFFIAILLVISMATVLRVQTYHYKNLLPKLLVMAVLINFSKMFVGIMIDASQIIMLFFGNALSELGGSVVLASLGLHQLYNYSQEGTELPENQDLSWATVYALIYAIILSVIAVVVVGIVTIILIYRIVMLWFLVILSPVAFLATTIPQGSKFAGTFWSKLTNELIVGPIMLFFLYLSFVAGAVDLNTPTNIVDADGTGDMEIDANGNDIFSADDGGNITTELNDPVKLFDFLIIIGLMVGSLIAGQMAGAAGGSWAGKGLGFLKGSAKKVGGFGLRTAGRTAARGGILGGRVATATTMRLTGNRLGKFGNAWMNDLNKGMDKSKQKKRAILMKKLGMGDKANELISSWGKDKDGKPKGKMGRLGTRLKGAAGGAAGGALAGFGLGWAGGPIGAVGGAIAGGIMGAIGGLTATSKHTIAVADKERKTSRAGQARASALNNVAVKDPITGKTYGQAEAEMHWRKPNAFHGPAGELHAVNKEMLDKIDLNGLRHLAQSINGMAAGKQKTEAGEAFATMLAGYKDAKGSNMKPIDSFMSETGHGQANEHLKINDAMLEALIKANTARGPQTMVEPADADPEKYGKTGQALAAYKQNRREGQTEKDAETEFFVQNENNADYMDQRTFKEARRQEQWYQEKGSDRDISSFNGFAHGGNKLAVNFDKLDMVKLANDAGVDLTDGDIEQIKSTSGLNLGSIKDPKLVAGIQTQLKAMMQGEIRELEAALATAKMSDTGEAELEVEGEKKLFSADQISGRLEMAKKAQAGLDDLGRVNKLELLNNTKGGRDRIVHEAAHTTLNTLDSDGRIQRQMFNQHYNEQERQQIIAEQRRKTKNQSLSESQAINEHFTELETKAIRRDKTGAQYKEGMREEMLSKLNTNAAKLNPSVAVKQEATPAEKKEMRQVIESNQDVKLNLTQIINNNTSAGGVMATGGLFSDGVNQFWLLRKLVMNMSKSIDKMGIEQKVRLGALGDKMTALNTALPSADQQGSMSAIEIKAMLEDTGITEDDLANVVKDLQSE